MIGMETDETCKIMYYYWGKVFAIQSAKSEKNYGLLRNVVKFGLTIQNGNENVERSVSDNKNMLTNEITNSSDETLMGLQRMKEYCRAFGGAHNINTLSKDIL